MGALLTVAVVLAGYSAFSAVLSRWGITSAMAFLTLGLVAGSAGLGWLDVPIESSAAELVTELALAFLLFSDSARIDLAALRHGLSWPTRLLLVGLPLTLVAGIGAGLLTFPGLSLTTAFLLSTMLCSTDAALGQRVVDDPAVPSRVRQALDVESGLNDGIAVPFFLVALDLSMAELTGGLPSAVLRNLVSQIGWGVLAGVGLGALGGLLLKIADEHGWLQAQWRQLFTLAVALAAYSAASVLGGSGFIAAFVAGMAFGKASGQRGLRTTYLAEEAGSLFAAVTWMGFGALAIGNVYHDITWQVLLYAALSLTVVRMLPVALAMIGSGARWQTTTFIGWFGPRGLASIVFGLLAVERGIPDAETVLATVVVTVGISVFAHGLSAKPLVAVYHRWYSGQVQDTPSSAEAQPTAVPRGRLRFGAEEQPLTTPPGPSS
jgi:sodium/hydrogen antiporter